MISLDVIRAELRTALAELELRLVDRFAAKSDHDLLQKQTDDNTTWINRMKGAIAILIAVVSAIGAYVLQHFLG